ncbi:MAG: hemolysin family protein [Finegoldia sp.]|nr:hemolysin family protein [Finegoldia sp.]
MDATSLAQLVAIVFCIIGSSIFSSSETALVSLSDIKLRQLDDEKYKNAKKVKYLKDNFQTTLSTILIGNNIVNIAASSLATLFFTRFFPAKGAVLSTVVMTILVLIFGEVTPKTLAQSNSLDIALKVSPLIYLLTILFKPLVFLLNIVTKVVINLFGNVDDNDDKITEDEIKTIVEVSEEQGVLRDHETEMMMNALSLKDTLAIDIMTPRTSMLCLDINSLSDDISQLAENFSYSRIPIYEDNIDDIIGILHIKELAKIMLKNPNEPINIKGLLKPAFYAYENISIIDLFVQMRTNNVSIAIIIDEYGGTSGLVTVEDIVEELVGEIDDEYDSKKEISPISENEFLVDPEMRIEDFNHYFNMEIHSDDFDSIGGFVIEQLDRLPENNDRVEYENLTFTVLNVNRRKLESLKLEIN